MYELLIRLYNELDYKRYTIKELEEMKEIIESLGSETEEVRLKRIDENDKKRK